MEAYKLCAYVLLTFFSWFASQLIVTITEQWHAAILRRSNMSRIYFGMLCVSYFGLIVAPFSLMFASRHFVATHDTSMLMISFLGGLLLISLGAYIASRDRVFVRDKEQLFHLFLTELHRQPMATARNPHAILRHALTTQCSLLLMAGSLVGVGMIVIFIGLSQSLRVTVSYEPLVMSVAILAALLFSTLSFLLLFRVQILFPQRESLRQRCIATIAASACINCAIFTAATSVSTAASTSFQFTLIVSLSTVILLAIMEHIVILDMRRQLHLHTRRLHSGTEEDSVVERVSKRLQIIPEIKSINRISVRRINPLLTPPSPKSTATNDLLFSCQSATRDAEDEFQTTLCSGSV